MDFKWQNFKENLDFNEAAAAAKSLQSCPTLCDPMDGSPPGSPVPGILQARTLEWVAISFSSAWKWKVKVKSLRCVWLLVTSWTAAYQAPLSMGFSRQEYWSRVPLPSPCIRQMLPNYLVRSFILWFFEKTRNEHILSTRNLGYVLCLLRSHITLVRRNRLTTTIIPR